MIKADEITIKAYKSKIKELKRKIEELFEEKAETNELLETSQKNFESLTIEYEGAKKRLIALKLPSSENICNYCRKSYKEANNFKWSCKTHLSPYSGTIWWCCGKTDKNAEGCRVSNHVNTEFFEVESKKLVYKIVCSVLYI